MEASQYSGEDLISVEIFGEDIPKHKNGEGNDGWWIGVGFEAPDNVSWENVKYYFGRDWDEITATTGGITSADYYSIDEKDYLAFYLNYGDDEGGKDVINIDWGNGKVCCYRLFADISYEEPLVRWPGDNEDNIITTISALGDGAGSNPYQLMQINYERCMELTNTEMVIIMKSPQGDDPETGTILWREEGGTSVSKEAYWQWSYRDASTLTDNDEYISSGPELDGIERANVKQLNPGSVVTISIWAERGNIVHNLVHDYTITADDITNSTYTSN